MNLGYIEKDDKVLVIDENGDESERKNTENIYDILSYENGLEFLDDCISDYEEVLSEIIDKIKYLLEYKKVCSWMFFYGGTGVFLMFGFAYGFNISSVIRAILAAALPTLGFAILKKIQLNRENKNKIEVEFILNNLKQEKKDLEQKLEQVKANSNEIIRENSQINYRKIGEEIETALDNRITIIERESEELHMNNKPKTLKKIRKK